MVPTCVPTNRGFWTPRPPPTPSDSPIFRQTLRGLLSPERLLWGLGMSQSLQKLCDHVPQNMTYSENIYPNYFDLITITRMRVFRVNWVMFLWQMFALPTEKTYWGNCFAESFEHCLTGSLVTGSSCNWMRKCSPSKLPVSSALRSVGNATKERSHLTSRWPALADVPTSLVIKLWKPPVSKLPVRHSLKVTVTVSETCLIYLSESSKIWITKTNYKFLQNCCFCFRKISGHSNFEKLPLPFLCILNFIGSFSAAMVEAIGFQEISKTVLVGDNFKVAKRFPGPQTPKTSYHLSFPISGLKCKWIWRKKSM